MWYPVSSIALPRSLDVCDSIAAFAPRAHASDDASTRLAWEQSLARIQKGMLSTSRQTGQEAASVLLDPASVLACAKMLRLLNNHHIAGGGRFHCTFSDSEAAQWDAALAHASWPALILVKLGGFGGSRTLLETSLECVPSVGWKPLTTLLLKIYDAAPSWLQNTQLDPRQHFRAGERLTLENHASRLLRRVLISLLKQCDTTKARQNVDARRKNAVGDEAKGSLTATVCLVYRASRMPRDGSVLGLALPTMQRVRQDRHSPANEEVGMRSADKGATTVVQWLFAEERWRALLVCLKELTDPEHLPAAVLLHVSSFVSGNPAARCALHDFEPLLQAADDDALDRYAHRSAIPPQSHACTLPPLDCECIWLSWLSAASKDDRQLCDKMRALPLHLLNLRGGSGQLLIHFAARRGQFGVVEAIVARAPLQASSAASGATPYCRKGTHAAAATSPPSPQPQNARHCLALHFALDYYSQIERRRRMAATEPEHTEGHPTLTDARLEATLGCLVEHTMSRAAIEDICESYGLEAVWALMEQLMDLDLTLHAQRLLAAVSPHSHFPFFVATTVVAARFARYASFIQAAFDQTRCFALFLNTSPTLAGPRCAFETAVVTRNDAALDVIQRLIRRSPRRRRETGLVFSSHEQEMAACLDRLGDFFVNNSQLPRAYRQSPNGDLACAHARAWRIDVASALSRIFEVAVWPLLDVHNLILRVRAAALLAPAEPNADPSEYGCGSPMATLPMWHPRCDAWLDDCIAQSPFARDVEANTKMLRRIQQPSAMEISNDGGTNALRVSLAVRLHGKRNARHPRAEWVGLLLFEEQAAMRIAAQLPMDVLSLLHAIHRGPMDHANRFLAGALAAAHRLQSSSTQEGASRAGSSNESGVCWYRLYLSLLDVAGTSPGELPEGWELPGLRQCMVFQSYQHQLPDQCARRLFRMCGAHGGPSTHYETPSSVALCLWSVVVREQLRAGHICAFDASWGAQVTEVVMACMFVNNAALTRRIAGTLSSMFDNGTLPGDEAFVCTLLPILTRSVHLARQGDIRCASTCRSAAWPSMDALQGMLQACTATTPLATLPRSARSGAYARYCLVQLHRLLLHVVHAPRGGALEQRETTCGVWYDAAFAIAKFIGDGLAYFKDSIPHDGRTLPIVNCLKDIARTVAHHPHVMAMGVVDAGALDACIGTAVAQFVWELDQSDANDLDWVGDVCHVFLRWAQQCNRQGLPATATTGAVEHLLEHCATPKGKATPILSDALWRIWYEAVGWRCKGRYKVLERNGVSSIDLDLLRYLVEVLPIPVDEASGALQLHGLMRLASANASRDLRVPLSFWRGVSQTLQRRWIPRDVPLPPSNAVFDAFPPLYFRPQPNATPTVRNEGYSAPPSVTLAASLRRMQSIDAAGGLAFIASVAEDATEAEEFVLLGASWATQGPSKYRHDDRGDHSDVKHPQHMAHFIIFLEAILRHRGPSSSTVGQTLGAVVAASIMFESIPLLHALKDCIAELAPVADDNTEVERDVGHSSCVQYNAEALQAAVKRILTEADAGHADAATGRPVPPFAHHIPRLVELRHELCALVGIDLASWPMASSLSTVKWLARMASARKDCWVLPSVLQQACDQWWQPVLERTPALCHVVLLGARSGSEDVGSVRFKGGAAAVRLVWRPLFRETQDLSEWVALLPSGLSLSVAQALRDELAQRGLPPLGTTSAERVAAAEVAASHITERTSAASVCRNQHCGARSFHALLTDYRHAFAADGSDDNAPDENDEDGSAAAGRLTMAQLACMAGEGNVVLDPTVAASTALAQLSGCLEQGWRLVIDHVDPDFDNATLACLTIPPEVNFLSAFVSGISTRCPAIVATNGLMHTDLCSDHNAILLQCLCMECPRTLHVTLRRGAGDWQLTAAPSSDGASCVLKLELFATSSAAIVIPRIAEEVYHNHLPKELIDLLLRGLSPLAAQPSGVTMVVVPLSDAEQHRVDTWVASLSRGRQALLRRLKLLASMMDRALGAGSRFEVMPDDHRLNVSQRTVDEILSEMGDAGLPEVTMHLLQHMLDEHHRTLPPSTLADGGDGDALRLVGRQTSNDPNDLYCCVCYATSLLEAPVMLQCYHLLCGQCVSRLVSHGLHRCPICNAYTLRAPKIRILLPIPPSPTKEHEAAAVVVKDEFADAPTLVAALCHKVLDDVKQHLGIDVNQHPDRNWYRNPTRKPEEACVWIVFHSDDALKCASPFITILRRKLLRCTQRGVGIYASAGRNPYQAQIHAYSRQMPLLGYLVGPQDRSFLALASPAWRQPWCVHKWTWLIFAGTSPATSLQPQALEDMRHHYGVHIADPQTAVTMPEAEDASTREDYLRW